ncbi:MAG: endopeptidase La [Muribaculaceae bacterium]|nr:endopeptidase La [Muribaculaceae bacterium]
MSKLIDENEPKVTALGHIEINTENHNIPVLPDDLPVLPTRNLVLFPGVTIPVSITRESALKLVRQAADMCVPVGIVAQRTPHIEEPGLIDLCEYGVVADVFKVISLGEDHYTAIVRGRDRFRIAGRGKGEIIRDTISVKAELLSDEPFADYENFKTVLDEIVALGNELDKQPESQAQRTEQLSHLSNLADKLNFLATTVPADVDKKQEMLAEGRLDERAVMLLRVLLKAKEEMSLLQSIYERARTRMTENQKNAFLQSQMDSIREELYGEDDPDSDFMELTDLADKSGMPAKVREIFDHEVGKLRRLNITTPDYQVQYSYLSTLVRLPWRPYITGKKLTVARARQVLDADHYGLEKVKQRVLEQIAVVLNSDKAKAPILCLVGPPGVGKTSLGHSIAEALGRKYVRVSLGGVHDESEIRGHRRTYIGAMPGRIIKALKEAGCNNPVILLDEVDKLSGDHRGDPAAALLEVLDPEQNSTFHDNYIDADYDLSGVLFIATANTLSTIPAPLLDRMEVIDLSGYLLEEKVQIATQHLIPKVSKENGLERKSERIHFAEGGLEALIERYTAESGVRQLEKQLASLTRKKILARMSGKRFPSRISPDNLKELLGLPKHNHDKADTSDIPGVVTGLAWTSVGGEILLAEAALSPGKGERQTITGNLGDVMKESATIAHQWVKSHAAQLGIEPDKFATNDLHIHFPEGAIPKDGPSAGITIATAIASVYMGRPVRKNLAMTGEITLRGKVLPVGGIKEKILAAKRAGVTDIILSKSNKADIEDIDPVYLKGVDFHYVDTVSEVIDFALNY